MGESSQAPGFFGKLSSHGDFVTRRLPPAVRLCFDHWLQHGLVQSRADLGEAWLPTWLGSPLWRFVVAAGVCGEQAWAGVMMPSHDRVGRCFPLLLAAAVDATPALADCLTLHDGWFARIEALALSTLEEGFSLEAFDAVLIAMDGAPKPGRFADKLIEGQSAWWTQGSSLVMPCVALCSGLPSPTRFAALLDGRWDAHGWEGPITNRLMLT